MNGRFFDTNILVYLALEDRDKAEAVKRLIVAGGMVSVQVLNELVNVARRKHQKPWPEVTRFTDYVKDVLIIVPLTVKTHDSGVQLAQRHGFAIYDSMILAAALEANCDTLWSEDMQHGMFVESRLAIRNPFLG